MLLQIKNSINHKIKEKVIIEIDKDTVHKRNSIYILFIRIITFAFVRWHCQLDTMLKWNQTFNYLYIKRQFLNFCHRHKHMVDTILMS